MDTPLVDDNNVRTQAKSSKNETAKNTRDSYDETSEEEQEKNIRVLPIILKDKAVWQQVANALRAKKINYNKAQSVQTVIKVEPSTIEDYRQIQRMFTSEKLEFYSYPLPTEKNIL